MSKHAHLRPHSLLVLRIAGCGRRRNECACECADDCHPHARQRRPFDRLVSVPLTAIKAQAGTASYTFTLTAASPATPKPVATVEPPQSPGKALTARPPALTIVSGNDQTVVPAVAGGIADFWSAHRPAGVRRKTGCRFSGALRVSEKWDTRLCAQRSRRDVAYGSYRCE
jgi:hypothetical protein